MKNTNIRRRKTSGVNMIRANFGNGFAHNFTLEKEKKNLIIMKFSDASMPPSKLDLLCKNFIEHFKREGYDLSILFI